MIITCNNCSAKFNVDDSVIPENGRLLQCNSCNNKWFFKKEIIVEPVTPVKINKITKEIDIPKEEVALLDEESPKTIELLDSSITEDPMVGNASIENEIKKNENNNPKVKFSKNKKKYNVLGLIIVFIISFVALIIFLDTFQIPIGKIVPNIEFFLYNLYETINDIVLFFSDLI